MNTKEYDMIVIGSGPAGEKAAIEASSLNKSSAIVEAKSLQGGVCLHTGTIPSKTLRETVLYMAGLKKRSAYGLIGPMRSDMTIRELMFRKEQVIQSELDVIAQNMARHQIEVIQGRASFINANEVKVENQQGNIQTLKAQTIVIATGTRSLLPDNIPFDNHYIYDADTILELDKIPKTLTIIGAGVIGCEYASIFSHLGVKVTLIDKREKLLSFLDSEIAEALNYLMRKYGITLLLNESTEDIHIENDQVITTLGNNRKVVTERLLYTAGRLGNTEKLGLEKLKIETDERGIIKVDQMYRTACKNIFAVGDVIGFPSLASVSMDQGRLAAIHAFGKDQINCLNSLLPFGIYTIPEVSIVGDTEDALKEGGIDYEIGVARYFELARGQIINDHDGMLKIIFDPKSKAVLGVHIIGERATELIHIGQAVMSHGGILDYFVNTVFNYPTLAEAYKVAALDGLARLKHRR